MLLPLRQEDERRPRTRVWLSNEPSRWPTLLLRPQELGAMRPRVRLPLPEKLSLPPQALLWVRRLSSPIATATHGKRSGGWRRSI